MARLIYKICNQDEWSKADRIGWYNGSPDDLRDGFIHFSTAGQLEETANRHFAGQGDLIVIAFKSKELGVELKWEPSRGGQLFPHYYGALETSQAVWVKRLVNHEGAFDLSGLALEAIS